MKTLTFLTSLFFLFTLSVNAQENEKKWSEIKIKSSVVCKMCKSKIENELAFTKGIKKAVVNIEKNEIVVVYNNKKTNADEIKIAITKIGYRADDLPANKEAFDKLEACCKSPEGCKDK